MIPRYRSPLSLSQAVLATVGKHTPSQGRVTPGLPEYATVFTSSAADALYQALKLIERSGTVVMSAYTCFRVVVAVRAAGWRPRFVDVDATTGWMLEDELVAALSSTRGSRVLLATHLYGIPTPLDRLRVLSKQYGATLIEDCAMSQGALHKGRPVGSYGDFAVFSFGLGKVLSLGIGGAFVSREGRGIAAEGVPATGLTSAMTILTRAGALGSVRFQAQEGIKKYLPATLIETLHRDERFDVTHLSEGAARILHAVMDMPHLETYLNALRERSVKWLRFAESLGGDRISTFKCGTGDSPCCPGLPLIVEGRNQLQEALRSRGVDSARYFDYCAAARDGQTRRFPNSQRLAASMLMLPLHPAVDGASADIEEILFKHANRRP